METPIIYGAEVIDKDKKVLGKVDYIIRDTWTGNIRKFMVKTEKGEIFLSPDEVIESTQERITVDHTANG